MKNIGLLGGEHKINSLQAQKYCAIMLTAKRKGEKSMARSDSNGMTNNAGIAYGELIRRQRKAKKMNQE